MCSLTPTYSGQTGQPPTLSAITKRTVAEPLTCTTVRAGYYHGTAVGSAHVARTLLQGSHHGSASRSSLPPLCSSSIATAGGYSFRVEDMQWADGTPPAPSTVRHCVACVCCVPLLYHIIACPFPGHVPTPRSPRRNASIFGTPDLHPEQYCITKHPYNPARLRLAGDQCLSRLLQPERHGAILSKCGGGGGAERRSAHDAVLEGAVLHWAPVRGGQLDLMHLHLAGVRDAAARVCRVLRNWCS